ncbi:three-helix bundle dimerization domain-containing protein [Actinoplanes sp. NPDC051513]|uniref:three-helix bundle dimerization domain-containing protein n=1 Tax=Actinoplanes sp. NPDC051513 TaxID=3363908 RepID=UPI0037A0EF21
MTEPATDGVVDPETALRREVDTLAQRFPDVDRAELDERVHATYRRLKEDATVDAHLVAMTEGQVTEELRERGETVHVRGSDAG